MQALPSPHVRDRMYQYSRAIYQSIKDLVDPYADRQTQVAYRCEVLAACEGTLVRLATDPDSVGRPARALFREIRHFFPIAAQGRVAWSVTCGVAAAVEFVGEHAARVPAHCHATTRRGQPCERTPLAGREYCPSHQHLERSPLPV